MTYATIFYAGLPYESYPDEDTLNAVRLACDQELYNGAFIYYHHGKSRWEPRRWYRMDLTPVLDTEAQSDVPPELKAYVLLLS